MKFKDVFVISFIFLCSISYALDDKDLKVIDESGRKAVVQEVVEIDKVWSGHSVNFCLLTSGQHQFVAYYNANRRMMAGMRKLNEKKMTLFELPSKTDRYLKAGEELSSTILGWDSHNTIVMAIDKKGYIHLSGNMHGNNLTYFRSQKPYDVTTLVQIDSMIGKDEEKVTYPAFMELPDNRLLFHYRYGKSGSGNEIYNVYDANSQTWSRFLDVPLIDGKKHDMNAYQQPPLLGPDGWYHMSWVWRDTYDAATNHDLSYMKSPDMKNWYDVKGNKLALPVTFDTNGLIVDPIPIHGGIINGSGKVGFDNRGRVVLAYHKHDEKGNMQAYCARYETDNWKIYKLTDWNYRLEFGGGGSLGGIGISLGSVVPRSGSFLELEYSHKEYGSGCWLIAGNNLTICGKVIKAPKIPGEVRHVESKFPGMGVRTCEDIGNNGRKNIKYILKWETLGPNMDLPREGELPETSQLFVYKIGYSNN